MSLQSFINRILETENLTSSLEDAAADDLLKWGVSQVDDLIKNIAIDDIAGDKVNQLIGVMRDINLLAGDPLSATPNAIADLKNKYYHLLGARDKVNPDECKAIARQLTKLAPHDSLGCLIDWLAEK